MKQQWNRSVLTACFLALLALQCTRQQQPALTVEGTWLPTSAEFSGSPFPDKILKTITLVLTEKTYTVSIGNVNDIGTLTLHPESEPKSMDILGTEGPNKGKTFLAIYELTGDTLTICYDLAGKNRPRTFATSPNTQLFLVHYKRSGS
jgi:uncharacterized protein (TIGR03067 family)